MKGMQKLEFRIYAVRCLGLSRKAIAGMTLRERRNYLLRQIFVRPFFAPSLHLFWRYWNPVYGYYLGKYVYRPCRRLFPHPVCVVITFAFCGLVLHDMLGWPAAIVYGRLPFPIITVWFTMIAVVVVVSEACRLRFDGLRASLRPLVHAGYLAVTLSLAHLAAG